MILALIAEKINIFIHNLFIIFFIYLQYSVPDQIKKTGTVSRSSVLFYSVSVAVIYNNFLEMFVSEIVFYIGDVNI